MMPTNLPPLNFTMLKSPWILAFIAVCFLLRLGYGKYMGLSWGTLLKYNIIIVPVITVICVPAMAYLVGYMKPVYMDMEKHFTGDELALMLLKNGRLLFVAFCYFFFTYFVESIFAPRLTNNWSESYGILEMIGKTNAWTCFLFCLGVAIYRQVAP